MSPANQNLGDTLRWLLAITGVVSGLIALWCADNTISYTVLFYFFAASIALSFLDDVYVRARGYMHGGEYGFARCLAVAVVMCLKDWSVLVGYVFSIFFIGKLIAAAGHTGPALLFVTGFLLLLLVHDRSSEQGARDEN